MLRRFRGLGIRTALVTTTEHPFFLPAQRMYVACGFREVSRLRSDDALPYRLIEYSLEL